MSDTNTTTSEELNSGHLLSFIERIERLQEEKTNISNDIKDTFSEAKGSGFDTKILRKVLKIRAQDRDEFREQEEILSLYLEAVGISV